MTLLEARDVGYRIDSVTILDAIDFDLAAGELVGLIGPNGAGKSSLLRMLAGIATPGRGEIRFAGEPLAQLSPQRRAQNLGYLVQDARAHWPFSVEKVVGLGRLPYQGWWQRDDATDRSRVEQALELTETLAYRNRIVTTLSGGEQTLVMLARVFAGECRVILADEPVAALDPYHQLHVMEVLRQYAAGARAAVVVLHDLGLAARFCDRLYLLSHGRLDSAGGVAEVLTPATIARVYGVVSRVELGADGVGVTPVARIGDRHP